MKPNDAGWRDPRFTELDRLIAAEERQKQQAQQRQFKSARQIQLHRGGRPRGPTWVRYGFAALDRREQRRSTG